MWIRENGVLECWSAEVLAGAHEAGYWAGRASAVFALLLLVALGGGCKKSAPAPSLLPPAPPALPETVARIRWLGKQRLAADTNAAFVMGIWNLPESKALEAQTLDRLAVGLLGGSRGAGTSNQSSVISNRGAVISNRLSVISNRESALLRPLLDDLLQQESFVEVRQATNQPGELTLTIRLAEERARLWQTNLAAVLESLTGRHAAAVPSRTNGWRIPVASHQSPVSSNQSSVISHQSSVTSNQSPATRFFELARAGEWTVISLGPEHNALAGDLLSLIQINGVPYAQQPKDFWLYAEGNLRRVASALSLSWDLPADLPSMALGVTGDGQMVHTRGQLNFAKPLPFELEPWNIPTNLIHEPLVSFTAIRGIRPWLSSLKFWQGLELGAPPDQLCFWAQNGPEFLSYFAAPMTNASNWVERATDRLLQKPNAYLAAEGMGRFERSTTGAGAVWTDVIFMAPYLQPVALSGGDFVFGGLVSSSFTNRPPPAELLHKVLGGTNLVAYDWELTGPRLDEWLHFGQLIRFALHLAQLPGKSASFAWLTAIEPKLESCVTAVTRTGPAQLTLTRRSELGLSAAELDWLADWLESPQFPRGLHTFLGPPVSLRPKRAPRLGSGSGTNSVPPARRQP